MSGDAVDGRVDGWSRLHSVAVPLVTLALLAACGGSSGEQAQGSGAEAARFVADDIAFEAAPETVSAGILTVELANEGSLPHDVTVEELDDVTVVETTGGETATGEVELDEGTYTYYCSVAGHRQAGMEGTFEVGAAGG